MTSFDAVLITSGVTLLGCFIGTVFGTEKKKRKTALLLIVIITLVMILLCILAEAFQWDSSILKIPHEDNPPPSSTTLPSAAPSPKSIITFGLFEQDNSTANGAAPIEWIVLNINSENQVLLIAKYGLLYKPFEESGVAHVWGESSLRNWLNEDFINTAFSDDERACILLQESLLTERSSTFTTPVEDSYSDDYIFCLSIQEVEQYFQPRESRVCIPTTYAKTTFAGDKIQPEGDHWWLRNPGTSLGDVACVRGEGQPGEKPGTINEFGCHSNGGGTLVRPAMWISWDAYIALCEQN